MQSHRAMYIWVVPYACPKLTALLVAATGDMTIGRLKGLIREKRALGLCQLHLKMSATGPALPDHQTLDRCKIKHGCSLRVTWESLTEKDMGVEKKMKVDWLHLSPLWRPARIGFVPKFLRTMSHRSGAQPLARGPHGRRRAAARKGSC